MFNLRANVGMSKVEELAYDLLEAGNHNQNASHTTPQYDP
jgi:hypothetical protein